MLNKVKSLALAAVVTVAMPIASYAATISGQLDINGQVNLLTSDFSATGGADLEPVGSVNIATGDFGSLSFGDLVALTDIDFDAPGTIWTVGGFSFVASSFGSFVDDVLNKGFRAQGVISGAGFDDTLGELAFSTQTTNPNLVTVSFSSTTTPVPVPAAGFLLIAGIGSLAVAGRRKKAA